MQPNRAKRVLGINPIILYITLTLGTLLLCTCLGSVQIPLKEVFFAIGNALGGRAPASAQHSIIVLVRLPRVLCAALVGGALSLCGGAMQGLLRNPLADGSTLGVSTGASLGAAIAIAFGVTLPGFAGGGTMLLAIVFALLSLLFILALAHKVDYSFSTNTIILVGVVFSMFASSLISLIIAFAGDKVKSIVFWTMGSLAGSTYTSVLTLLVALATCSIVLLRHARELNAFAIGEDNARHLGINVRRVKAFVMVAVSVLIGVCVSVGGTIGFVGLIIPHIVRLIGGPNHKRLLPASLFCGGIFLMLADLAGRTLLSPVELPVGVVTSIIGSVVFIAIFYSKRKVR